MKVDFLYRPEEPLWQRLLLTPLRPLAGAFGAASATRRKLYEAGRLRQVQVSIPVVSVGNLVAGGAGKTPVVIHLTRWLQSRGLRVAVLSRGYGGTGRGARVVSKGEGLLLPASDAGDEPVLIANRCPGALVLVGPDRADLAVLATSVHKADVIVLDDGFQHLALARDLDIVVLDGAAPFGNGHLLPRGPLREPKEALARAQLVWISKVDEGDPEGIAEAAEVAKTFTSKAPIRSRYTVSELLGVDGTQRPAGELKGRPVLLLAGVARPDSFRRTLLGMGAKIVDEALFADHHAFTRQEAEGVLSRARAAGAEFVCCTEKDAVRLPASLHGEERLRVIRVDTEIVEGRDTLAAELERILLAKGARS